MRRPRCRVKQGGDLFAARFAAGPRPAKVGYLLDGRGTTVDQHPNRAIRHARAMANDHVAHPQQSLAARGLGDDPSETAIRRAAAHNRRKLAAIPGRSPFGPKPLALSQAAPSSVRWFVCSLLPRRHTPDILRLRIIIKSVLLLACLGSHRAWPHAHGRVACVARISPTVRHWGTWGGSLRRRRGGLAPPGPTGGEFFAA